MSTSSSDRRSAREAGLRREIKARKRELRALRAALRDGGPVRGVLRPQNLIWIFGSARTGSTWLSGLLGDPPHHDEWREPNVGSLFGEHYYRRMEGKYAGRRGKHWRRFWILGGHREVWLNSIRSFVLDGAAARFPHLPADGHLVIKEPHGSLGAPLLLEALPESRLVFLVRDPRDVAASALAARRRGSWLYNRRHSLAGGDETLGDVPPDLIIRSRARRYLRDLEKVRLAYDVHPGPKVLVRYEDLRAATVPALERIYADLGIPMERQELAAAAQRHAFETLQPQSIGPDKFRRQASPGGWASDLTPSQVTEVERIAAPVLEAYYGDQPPG